tara:strand:+ start:974 stop:1231 length:258 start_codon:yes stop_codon:yes gene_type:complete
MENKTSALGLGIALLTVGLGYLGYTVMNNQDWNIVNVEKVNNVEKIESTLEEEAVKKVEKSTSLLTRFWKNEFNEGFNTKVEDLE